MSTKLKIMEAFISALSGKEFPLSEKVTGYTIRQPIIDLICQDYPTFKTENNLSISELNLYREKYISNYLSKEVG